MSNAPLIFASTLATDPNVQSILQAMEAASPLRSQTSPLEPRNRPHVISLTDSEGESNCRPSPAQKPTCPTPTPCVFVIEGTDKSDEEYQEYLVEKAQSQATRELERAARRGRSTERHTRITEDRERSAKAHKRLAKMAGKFPEQHHASSGSHVDAEFDAMLANLTLDDDGGVFLILSFPINTLANLSLGVVDTANLPPPHLPTLAKASTPFSSPRVYNVRLPQHSGLVETWCMCCRFLRISLLSLDRPLAAHLTQGAPDASVKHIKTSDQPKKAYVVFAGTRPGIYNHW